MQRRLRRIRYEFGGFRAPRRAHPLCPRSPFIVKALPN